MSTGEAMFKGKVAIVTGGNSGMGKATALELARRGAKVVIAARREAEGEATARLAREQGGEALFVRCDVGVAGDVERLVGTAVEKFGGLHCAFNNAGHTIVPKPLAEESDEVFEGLFQVHLRGLWLCMKHEIRAMLATGAARGGASGGGGAIVNCGSVGAHVAIAGLSAYCTMKAGIVGMTKGAALDYAKQGIRINAIAPAVVETPAVEGYTADPQMRAAITGMHPLGRLGTPGDVAALVAFLLSDEAGWITGQSIVVDGGYTLA